jgi:hypothetical protein
MPAGDGRSSKERSERLPAPCLATESQELRPSEVRCAHALLDEFERRGGAWVPENRQAGRDLVLALSGIHDHRIAIEDGRLVVDRGRKPEDEVTDAGFGLPLIDSG